MALDDTDPGQQLDLIQRAGKISREQNKEILDGQIGAMAASVLAQNAQLLAMTLLHPGGDVESTEDLGANQNP